MNGIILLFYYALFFNNLWHKQKSEDNQYARDLFRTAAQDFQPMEASCSMGLEVVVIMKFRLAK